MPPSLIVVCCLLLFHSSAWADWVLVWTQATIPPTRNSEKEMTIKIKDRKRRVDIRPTNLDAVVTSTLSDANSGETITLMHPQKSYSKHSVQEGIERASTEPLAEPPKLHATGRTAKIGPYDTEEYTLESDPKKTSFWIVKDFPNREAILAAMDRAKPATEKTSDLLRGVKFPGMVLRNETPHGGLKVTMTLISVQEVSLSEADFEPPANYTETPQH